MIHLEPRLPSKEALQRLDECGRQLSAIEAIARAAESKATWKAARESEWFRSSVLQVLQDASPGPCRCWYCEDNEAWSVDHIRPRARFVLRTFEWENLALSCDICGRYKADCWAEVHRVSAAIEEDVSDGHEQPGNRVPAFVSPRSEDPMEVLELDLQTGVFAPRGNNNVDDARAEWTRDRLRLNQRSALLKQRKTAFGDFKRILREYVATKRTPQVTHATRADVQGRAHQTVWAEMKRQRAFHADLAALFNAAPEALTW